MGMNLDTAAPESSLSVLSPMEIDAIGEVLNISMGSAATAISTMLDKQVVITTPKVSVENLGSINCGELEPALIVKIIYTEGITGSNVMVFRQRDMQLILNQLMGIDDPPKDNFVFDELSMSAACEVMNQMMGASATALSEFLGKPINISTPTASVMDEKNTFIDAVGLDASESIVSVLFSLNIAGVINSEFVSVLGCDLAKEIVSQFMGLNTPEPETAPPQPQAVPTPSAPPAAAAPQPVSAPASPPAAMQPPMPAAAQQSPDSMGQMPPQGYPPQPQTSDYGQMPPQYPYPPQGMPGYPPYYPYPQQAQQGGYPMYPPYGYPPSPYPQAKAEPGKGETASPISVKPVQFPDFNAGTMGEGSPLMGGNMNLIMNVPLNVSIEIGKTKRKIKDIMSFTQGTVIELEKQAGAPVDIIVNGQLLAHGDVVVIDDNFGVRITEIVGTKELLNSLEEQIK